MAARGEVGGPRLDQRTAKLQDAVEQLKRESQIERVKVSVAAQSIKRFCNDTRDPLVPSVWGKLDDKENHYRDKNGKCIIL